MSTVAAVVELVQEICPDWAVEDFPDRQDEYTLTHPLGVILVQYGGSRYGDAETLGVMVQKRTMQFGLTVIGYCQHGEDGVVTKINLLAHKLAGRILKDCEAIRNASDQFVSEKNGIWVYRLEIDMDTLNVGQEILEV